MKIYKLLQVGMLASVFVLTGCASIVSHSNWPVTFKSEPSGAEIVITDKQGKQIHHGPTPLTVTLASGSGYFGSSDYCVDAKLPGYQDEKGEVKASFNGWYVGNIVFGGLIGFLIVDPLTGAMYRLPHEYTLNLSADKTYKSESKSLGSTDLPKASGSGFFITDDGYLISNYHVIKNAAKIQIVTSTGTFAAKVIQTDEANDLALLKVEGKFFGLPIAPSKKMALGSTVATVGFPDPVLQGFSPKLSKGEVAALAGAADDPHYFQISVPVQPGNSGGALVDEHGNVVGIVAAKLSLRAALASSGALPENVNYAVKSTYLLSLLESVPTISNNLKEPNIKDEKFEDVIKSAQSAAVLVLIY